MTKESTDAELWKDLIVGVDELLAKAMTLKIEVEKTVGGSANEVSDNALLFFPSPSIAFSRNLFSGSKN